MGEQTLPHIGSVADDITIIKSMHSEAINHDPAITYILTGTQQLGKPSFGSWISYGLGSPNKNLPSYIDDLTWLRSIESGPLLSLVEQRLPTQQTSGSKSP